MKMLKFLNNQNSIFLAVFCLNLLMLMFAISNLSISYYEAEIFFSEKNIVNFITKMSCEAFGQNDFALRMPFLFMHFINSILMYRVSKSILKRKIDRLICVIVYMFLPGIMASAILVNMAGVVIFFTLLFVYLYENKQENLAIFLLILTIAMGKSFSILYLGIFFYAIYVKNKKLSFVSLFLIILTLIFYDFDVGGKPKGYFLDTIGVYAAVFSPFVFMFFVYTIYRIWVKEEKNLLWFIVVTSFCVGLLLSFRQRVELEEFLPYIAIAIPLMIKVFFNSYRARLPIFRRKYNFLAIFLISTLSLYSLLVVFNQILYPIFFKNEPDKHFIYKYDTVKKLSKELKNLGIYEITALDEELKARLKFYSIENGGEYLVSDEKISTPKFEINVYSFDILIAKYYIF